MKYEEFRKLLDDRKQAPTREQAIDTLTEKLTTMANSHGRTITEHFEHCESNPMFDEDEAEFHGDYCLLGALKDLKEDGFTIFELVFILGFFSMCLVAGFVVSHFIQKFW